jgi:hypothetical protein
MHMSHTITAKHSHTQKLTQAFLSFAAINEPSKLDSDQIFEIILLI